MNFLAHLHLASIANSSLLGNLLADFVRGDPYHQFSSDIAQGVMLHRRIDKITDALPQVKAAKQYFVPAHRRVAAITLDVVWDHFLAKRWSRYSPETALPEFVQQARQVIESDLNLPQLPEDFLILNRYLWQENWLEAYADLAFIGEVLNKMAKRRPKLALLAASYQDVSAHYDALSQQFDQLYPELIAYTLAQPPAKLIL